MAHHGLNSQCGLLVNSSRGIIYAGDSNEVENAALTVQQEMKTLLAEHNLI